jgi:hypothetical protein
MESLRSVSAARLRRLREELVDEAPGVIDSSADGDVVLDELDYALRPPRHERRLPTYGSIVLPTVEVNGWAAITGLHTDLSRTTTRHDDDVRRYADGLTSWTVRSPSGIDALAVFDRSAGSERDLLVLGEATGGTIVQRRPDRGVRLVGTFGVARWDSAGWYVERPVGSWLHRASCGLADDEAAVLDRLLRVAVHDLGAAGIGALLVLGGRREGIEHRLAEPPPLRLDRPADLGPLRHVLAQVDGAAFFDGHGVLRHLGVRLVPSTAAETEIEALGGTRHTSARRYSSDDATATVVAVSEDGPVTVLRAGEIVGRSRADHTPPLT